MNINLLRWLDKTIGVAACVVISVFRPRRKKLPMPIQRVLIIKFWGMGSIVLAYDFFSRIRAQYPSARLVAFTLTQNRPAFEMSGLFDEIIALDIRNFWLVPLQCLRLLFRLRKEKFDLVFDLEFTARFSALWAGLLNENQSAGFTYRGIWRGDFFTHPVSFDERTHIKNNFSALARPFLREDLPEPGKITFSIDKDDGQIVERLLQQEKLVGAHPLIGVNINASPLCLLRRWPAEYFILLIQQLVKRYSAQVIFIGAKDEAAYVDRAIAQMPRDENIHNFAGRISLSQLAYLIPKFDLFISNDSGPLHLAAERGVPTASFFGPETPSLYGPQGEQHIIFYSPHACGPCIRIKNYKRGVCFYNQECLRSITPEEVMSAIARAGTLRRDRTGI